MDKSIIIRPIITEKSVVDGKNGKYTFQVRNDATKHMIAKAVVDAFKVSVISVATSLVKGKTKRFGKLRKQVKLSNWKKALVKVSPGQKIGIFEVGA